MRVINMVTISGHLLDSNNQALSGYMIKLKALSTSSVVVKGVISCETSDGTGAYSMDVPVGYYEVTLQIYGQPVINAGRIRVYTDSVDGTLNKYLNAPTSEPSPDWLKQVEDNRIAAEQAQHGAEQAQKAAEEAAANSLSNVPHEFQYNKVRNALRDIYDASGVVNWGKYGSDPINQGMYTDLTTPNSLMWGGGANGDSETPYPVLNVAGNEIHVRGINSHDTNTNKLSSQGAEDGTTVTDSTGNCRGSGKAVLNLKTDIDPKYGNAPTGTAAEIQREGVNRAFEGLLKNNNFRTNDGTHWREAGTGITYTNGVVSGTSAGYILLEQHIDFEQGVTYEFTVNVKSDKSRVRFADAGGIILNDGNVSTGINTFKVTATAGGRGYIQLGSREPSSVVSFSDVIVRKVTEDVLTRAVDLKYLEVFPEEDELEFFPYGSVQSGLTTVDGFTTEASSRPDTYRAVFPGDTASSKQCLKIAKLSFVDIAKLMSNPKHNWFYNEAGKPTQVRYRDCARRGAGNGDWLSINPNVDGLKYSQQATVVPQGMKDLAPSPETTDKYIASPSHATATFVGEVNSGVYIARNTEAGIAYKGECYALVLCTVPRLNMGAYSHLNPFGSRSWASQGNAAAVPWNNAAVSGKIHSLQQSFIEGNLTPNDIGYSGVSGFIGAQYGGHPDNLRYDAIYASGFNGVIDHRQPAKSPQDDWRESLQGYYASKVRGVQKLPFTVVGNYTTGSGGIGAAIAVTDMENYPVGTVINVETASGDYETRRVSGRDGNSGSGTVRWVGDGVDRKTSGYCVRTIELDTSVSGAFSCNTVIADPANWVQTPQIAQGVIGVWSPVIGDGTNKSFPYVRKLLSQSSGVGTDNNGTSWWSASFGGFDSVTNAQVMSSAATSVRLMSYKAYAYQVEDGENLEPVGGQTGKVSCSAWYNPNGNGFPLFAEAAIHKVLKSGAGFPDIDMNLTCTRFNLDATGSIVGDVNGLPEHVPLSLGAPQNNSPAIKALPFLVEKNGYLYIAWHVNELGHTNHPTIGTVSGTANFSVDNHSLNRVDGGSMNGVVVMRVGGAASNTSLINCFVSSDGVVRNSDGTDLTQWWVVWNGSGWGDDSKIKVTSKGWDTFVDLNGNKMTRRVVISTFPIGPAKKKTLVGGLSSPA